MDLTRAPIKEIDDAISSYSEPNSAKLRNSEVMEVANSKSADLMEAYIPDDRENLKTTEYSLLVIDEDKFFARTVRRIVQKYGYKLLFARDGKEGMKLAAKYQPNGILLNEPLPDMKGLIVLEHLKFNLKTRHIPVYLMAEEDKSAEALNKGAMGFDLKPVSSRNIENAIQRMENLHNSLIKELLIIEDDEATLKAIKSILKNKEVKISSAVTGKDALHQLRSKRFDCIILDLNLPDITGFEVLRKLKSTQEVNDMPVVVYTGKELTKTEVKELRKFTDSIVIKGASSPELLLDEVSLFIHSDESKLSARQKKIMADLHHPKHVLKDKKVLLVDDDGRNSYALSKALMEAGMKVIVAENGKIAIEKLKGEKDVDIVLMDVMMPIMDGYEATTKIRKNAKYKNLPIISLTAKAMPEDKAKSLEGGANDYLTKPVNIDKLLNIVRLWLYQ
jgi:CheY-like chemotaxis protein